MPLKYKNNLAFLLTLSAALSPLSWAQTLNYLVVDELSRPFQVTEKSESKGGIVSDIVNEIFQQSPYQINTKVLPIKRLYKQLADHADGLWIAYDAKVWNSLIKWGNFIEEPLFSVSHSFMTCMNTPQKITSNADINGMRVAVLKNFDYPEMEALAKQNRITLEPVSGYGPGINLSKLKRVSGFVEMDIRLRYNVRALNDEANCLRYINMDKIIAPYDIYLSVAKSAPPELSKFIKQRIQEMKAKGEIKAILKRYK